MLSGKTHTDIDRIGMLVTQAQLSIDSHYKSSSNAFLSYQPPGDNFPIKSEGSSIGTPLTTMAKSWLPKVKVAGK
jgi:hypothetical protein